MKKRNPYKTQALVLNRFRGLAYEDGKHNIGTAFVGNTSNFLSQKIGEMNNREGQKAIETYGKGILNAGRLINHRFAHTITRSPATGSVYAESVTSPIPKPLDEYVVPEIIISPFEDSPSILAGYGSVDPLPSIICSDIWANNPDVSRYENEYYKDTAVTDDVSLCYRANCESMWELFPEFADYQVASEQSTTVDIFGGDTGLGFGVCWDENFNCKQLYKLHPEWDKYRDNQGYPNCWNFTKTVDQLTCQQYFDDYNVPAGLQKKDGAYPDCIVKDFAYSVASRDNPRVDLFEAQPSTILFEEKEGEYVSSETEQEIVVSVSGYFGKDVLDDFVVPTDDLVDVYIKQVDISYIYVDESYQKTRDMTLVLGVRLKGLL